jgi:hypothetical protein
MKLIGYIISFIVIEDMRVKNIVIEDMRVKNYLNLIVSRFFGTIVSTL